MQREALDNKQEAAAKKKGRLIHPQAPQSATVVPSPSTLTDPVIKPTTSAPNKGIPSSFN